MNRRFKYRFSLILILVILVAACAPAVAPAEAPAAEEAAAEEATTEPPEEGTPTVEQERLAKAAAAQALASAIGGPAWSAQYYEVCKLLGISIEDCDPFFFENEPDLSAMLDEGCENGELPKEICDQVDRAIQIPVRSYSCFNVSNQLVVIGKRDVIDNVVRDLQARELDITLAERVEVEPSWDNGTIVGESEDKTVSRPVIEVFDLYVGSNMDDLRSALADAQENGTVVAGPNHVAQLVESLDHSGGQSPFGKGPGLIDVGFADLDDFNNQWVFTQLGIDPSITETESGVPIGIFDTSPFGEKTSLEWGASGIPTVWPTTTFTGVSVDHGIFVAGLAHAAAPEANIHLYRVLDGSGVGDVQSIGKQIIRFINEFQPNSNVPAVINLSLGITCESPISDQDREDLRAFQALLHGAFEAGSSVIVAAAGNDSNRNATPNPVVLDPAYPADQTFVIGVGASTKMDDTGTVKPSCYSHAPEYHEFGLYVPAGDGFDSSSASNPPECTARYSSCIDNQCPYAVLSFAATSPSKYAYWSGTSFATPLASGLAARLIADGKAPRGHSR